MNNGENMLRSIFIIFSIFILFAIICGFRKNLHSQNYNEEAKPDTNPKWTIKDMPTTDTRVVNPLHISIITDPDTGVEYLVVARGEGITIIPRIKK